MSDRPESSPNLASQPTLSRLENSVSQSRLNRPGETLLDTYLAAHSGPPDPIVLDIDATDDSTHDISS